MPTGIYERIKPVSEKSRIKMSEQKIGKKNSFYGKKHTEATKKKISEKKKGKPSNNKGNHYKLSENFKEKCKKRTGEKAGNWQGGKTNEIRKLRNSIKYREWRNNVYKRDNWTCQECGVKSKKNKKVYLNAHHIKPFAHYSKLRFNINNGITLCIECHKNKTIFMGNQYFKVTPSQRY